LLVEDLPLVGPAMTGDLIDGLADVLLVEWEIADNQCTTLMMCEWQKMQRFLEIHLEFGNHAVFE
jgi:hypothetical protein